MRNFYLNRTVDVSGISGTGRVAQGIEFDNGKVAMCWLTATSSITVYDSIEHVEKIHSHEGATVIEWVRQPGVTTRELRFPNG